MKERRREKEAYTSDARTTRSAQAEACDAENDQKFLPKYQFYLIRFNNQHCITILCGKYCKRIYCLSVTPRS